MSALSDYIHLHHIHYLKYGISRKNESMGGIPNYSENVINNRINKNVKPIQQNIITELQKRLKENSDIEYQKSLNGIESRKQKLIDIIYEKLLEKGKNIDGIQRMAMEAQGGDVSWSTNNGWSQFQSSSSQEGSSWAPSNLTYQEILKRRNKSYQLYQNINTLIDEINSSGLQEEDKFLKLVNLFNQYSNLSLNPKKHTLGDIQAALQQCGYRGAIADVSGSFGEMMVAVCNDTCYNLAEKVSDETVRKAATEALNSSHLVGNQYSRATMSKSLVGVGYNITRRSPDNRNEYFLGTTQNKVDVKIKVKNEPILATVKTTGVSNSKRPTLQHVDLYPTLTFLNSQLAGLNGFGTHWLNMHSINKSAEAGWGTPMGINGLDSILKKEVAYEALSSGNPFKTGVDSANVFVHINRATGKVYVKSVQQLLADVNTPNSRIGGLQRISTMRYKNEWQPEIWQRLNDILRQVHETKIAVALNIKYD